jgi:hypothetical protein
MARIRLGLETVALVIPMGDDYIDLEIKEEGGGWRCEIAYAPEDNEPMSRRLRQHFAQSGYDIAESHTPYQYHVILRSASLEAAIEEIKNLLGDDFRIEYKQFWYYRLPVDKSNPTYEVLVQPDMDNPAYIRIEVHFKSSYHFLYIKVLNESGLCVVSSSSHAKGQPAVYRMTLEPAAAENWPASYLTLVNLHPQLHSR